MGLGRRNNMKIQDCKDFYKKKKGMVWLGVGLVFLLVITYTFFYSAQIQGYKYAFAYNHKNFQKVFGYYDKDTLSQDFSKEEIVDFLEEQIHIDGNIKVNKSNISGMLKEVFKGSTQKVEMPITYDQGKPVSEMSLTLLRDKKTKRWFVKFPYELQSIDVFAPAGSDIYIGKKKVKHDGMSEKVEIINTLPGKHQITIEYYNDLYPPFIKEIIVPMETRVESPYPTYNIAVFAPYNTWVTLGNKTKYNSGPSVLFENMLPGQYKVSIVMKDRELEIFTQTIQVDQKYTSVHLEKIAGNKAVQQNLSEYFDMFNIEYAKGIISRDTNFLHMFATEKINENLISDFKMWYIDQKDIKDAKSSMEIRDSYILSGTEIRASVLETVYLSNDDTKYRVVIDWNYKLLRNNAKWEIAERNILQSSVAYKNEAGKWIRY